MEQIFSNRWTRFRLITILSMLIFCFYDLRVAAQCTAPDVTIETPDTLSCINRTVTLNASSSTSGAGFSWSGPNGFTSFSQNPSVSIAGTFTLTVTSPTGGCTTTASVVVVQDTVQPDARTSVSGVMTCADPTITVSGLSETPNVTYSWIGPGSFTSTDQVLNVTVAGGYTLMVTAENGCTSTATAYVHEDIEMPTASAYVSGDLTCLVTSVDLTSSSATSSVTYSWTGPGFSSPVTEQNTSTSVGGVYTVTATNPTNGCQSSASVTVVADTGGPGASITVSNDTITCTYINAELSGNSPSTGVVYNWAGPGLSEEVQNVTVATAGTYVLSVTSAQNGCVSKDTAVIVLNKTKPDAAITVSGAITCTNPTASLTASSTTEKVNYKWTGPSAFGTSSSQVITTSVSGGYILSTTNRANGCITTKAAVVSKNVTLPASVTASVSGVLTCSNTSVTLTGSSSTPGVTYEWIGPNGSSYTGATPSVSTAGDYTLTVTHPTSGCTASTTVAVTESVSKPNVSAANNGPLTCTTTSVTLSGSSTTSGVTYQWKNSSGTVISTSQNTTVSTSGVYYLVATDTTNGCYSQTVTSVVSKTTKPANVTAGNDGPLSCSLTSASINASSSTSGVTYAWSGPDNFTSTTKNPTVSTPGTYKVTITNTATGCTDTTSTYLAQDVTEPGASIETAPTITCDNTSVTLSASSATADVTYLWSGPGTYTSTEQNAETNKAGDYTVTVTNTANNCTSTASVTVSIDTIAPAEVVIADHDSLTCIRSSVTLAASTSSIDFSVSYKWTGPSGFTSDSQTPDVATKGNYIVTVTNLSNGCKSYANTVVVKDSIAPADVAVSASGILNCANDSVTLTASSSTTGVTYSWYGAELPLSTTAQHITTASATTYYVTVTNPHNGCYTTASATVTGNYTEPESVSASSGGILTCATETVNVSVTSATSGVTYSWSGPELESNEQEPVVSLPGTYYVTVTHPVSQCTTTAYTTVSQDTVSPANVTAGYQNKITCTNTSSVLTGSSTTSGVTYYWDGPNGYTSALPQPKVYTAGLYTLTVTNSSNGCTKVRTLTLPADTTHPADVTAEASSNLNCLVQDGGEITLTGSSSTSGVGYEWYYSDVFFDNSEVTYAIFGAGDYTLIVTNATNGCTVSRTVTVSEDYTAPVCSLDVADNATVLQQTTNTISNTGTSSSYTYTWSITNWSILSGQGTNTLTYQSGATGSTSVIKLNLTDSNNGCSSSCSVTLTAVASKSAFAEEALSSGQTIQDVTLTAYPVPAVGKVTVEFTSPEETEATVIVYSTSGSVVASLFEGAALANQEYKLVFNDDETLPAGTYICVLKTKTKTIMSKIILK